MNNPTPTIQNAVFANYAGLFKTCSRKSGRDNLQHP